MIAANAETRRAFELHTSAIVWDNHVCMPLRVEDSGLQALARHRAAGATFVSLNLGDGDVPLEQMIRMAAHFRAWVLAHPKEYCLAQSVADVRRAKIEGRTAVGFDIEGAAAIGDQLSLLEVFHSLGVRWMLLAYNRANQVGGGCHDAQDQGLTPFGARFLAELERLGIVVCCSHTGYRTAREVLERARQPVIFSHSNARALHDHPRNIPDDLIRGCAATGGVVGLNGLDIFLGDSERLLERLIDHIDHVSQLVGIEHVGLGLDYVYDQAELTRQLIAARGIWPEGFGYEPGIRFLEPESLPRLTEALLARRYSDSAVRMILGENFLRVAEQVWK